MKDTPAAVPGPLLKWAGGKRQLLPQLQQRLPARLVDYFEPFVGGGALLWTLGMRKLRHIVVNDYNSELINLYQVVRSRPQELLASVAVHRNEAEYYYRLRALDREPGYQQLDAVTRASRFLYLNKTCYNGLWRVNSRGQHNVPFGRYKNPRIAEPANVYACSDFLQGVELLNGDFSQIRPWLGADSFVYLDPPYVPLSASSSFTGYTAHGFDAAMQQRLRELCDEIDRLGGKFMLSNSAAALVRQLYQGYRIEEVQAARSINSRAGGRGKITELIIRNY